MKLFKDLDFSNIKFEPRKRVQSLDGVLSLLTTSKDFTETQRNSQSFSLRKMRESEDKRKKIQVKRRTFKAKKPTLKGKAKKNKGKPVVSQKKKRNALENKRKKDAISLISSKKAMKDEKKESNFVNNKENNPQTGEIKEDFVEKVAILQKNKEKSKKISLKNSRISKKLRRINLEN